MSSVWSAIISGITLLAAIFSPIITAWLNNRHQREIFNNKFYTEHRAGVIENYINSASRYIHSQQHEDCAVFGTYSAEIYLHVSDDLWPIIDELNNCISLRNFDLAKSYLKELCKKLAKDAPRSKV